MKQAFYASAAALALTTGTAWSQDLVFTPGEGDFSWDSYEALKSVDLKGQELSIFGPWLGPDKDLV